MHQKSILKLLGLFILFGLLALAQPIAKELHREVNTLQQTLVGEVKATPIPPTQTAPSIEEEVLGATTDATSSGSLFTVFPVEKVVDGDTIKVLINDHLETIRIIGINTPEVVDPRKPVECFGKEASEHAKILLNGQSVSLESDASQGDKDKYGRLLRYVFLQDGSDFGLSMIKAGYAHEYTYDEPYKYRQNYLDAQKQAETQSVGLWSSNVCPVN